MKYYIILIIILINSCTTLVDQTQNLSKINNFIGLSINQSSLNSDFYTADVYFVKFDKTIDKPIRFIKAENINHDYYIFNLKEGKYTIVFLTMDSVSMASFVTSIPIFPTTFAFHFFNKNLISDSIITIKNNQKVYYLGDLFISVNPISAFKSINDKKFDEIQNIYSSKAISSEIDIINTEGFTFITYQNTNYKYFRRDDSIENAFFDRTEYYFKNIDIKNIIDDYKNR